MAVPTARRAARKVAIIDDDMTCVLSLNYIYSTLSSPNFVFIDDHNSKLLIVCSQ